MIKINLYTRKVAVGVSSGTTTAGLGKFSDVIQKLRSGDLSSSGVDVKSLIIQFGLYAVILIGGNWYAGEKRTALLADVDAQVAVVSSKSTLLTSELSKTSGYEQSKKNLEQDEKTIRTKIETIQELIRDRSAPPKILMTLSEATPKDVWLKELSLQNRKFHIAGMSNGMDVVSDFMKSLEETIYFKNVVLKSSKTDTAQKVGRQTTQFDLEGDRR